LTFAEASARSSRRLPMKHHGQARSENISMFITVGHHYALEMRSVEPLRNDV
jgi:hypothetical protein